MSLSVAGTWQVGVWATTVWADGVWREGAAAAAVVTGGGTSRKRKKGRVIRWSDLDERERIEALAAIQTKPFTPLEQAAINLGESDEEDQDDDALILAAAMRTLH